MQRFGILAIVAALAAALGGADFAGACSRVLWADNGQAVVVGRNMDWLEDMRTNLWAFPRGIARSGLHEGNALHWTSKYGSVGAGVYDLGIADGINEKGLVANLLWLTEADYGKRDEKLPGLSLSLWGQYMLDNFATVAEAVAAFEHGGFQIVPMVIPGLNEIATVHLALADASGDSAIIEIVDGGKARIHHGRSYAVMTNSPPYPEQLENLKKYQGFGGTIPLPGTNEAADRYVRAAFYLSNLPKPHDLRQTIAEIMSVIRNVAQPFMKGVDPSRPEASHTIWRAVADVTDRIYFYESTLSPNVIWVRLDGLDLGPQAPVRKLDLVHGGDLVGDVTGAFKPGAPPAFP